MLYFDLAHFIKIRLALLLFYAQQHRPAAVQRFRNDCLCTCEKPVDFKRPLWPTAVFKQVSEAKGVVLSDKNSAF